jgi:hypothetical protein
VVENSSYKIIDRQETSSSVVADQIYSYFENEVRSGRAEYDQTFINRASSANLCPRRLWYKANGHPVTESNGRRGFLFMHGDIAECAINNIMLKACVGDGLLYKRLLFGEQTALFELNNRELKTFKQQTLTTHITDTIKVYGHPDGMGELHDGTMELIEFKSAANYSFDLFKREGPGDYLMQAHCLMMSEEAKAAGIKSVRFVFVRKETSHVFDKVYKFDINIANKVTVHFKKANSKVIPDRPYE